jgi:flagellar basal body-associated protein FliL
MDPISIVLVVTFYIFALAYFTLHVLMLKNRSETGKKEFWNLSYQFCYIWLISSELYNEKGNRYRKILLRVLLIGLPLIISLIIADAIT